MSPRLLLGLSLLLAPFASAQAQAPAPKEYRVLLVGNSLTYTNNLPALLRAVGASQGTTITTETYAAPGGTLSERWRDGKAAEALRTRKFDVVVLQEMGGRLACLGSAAQRTAPCAASLHAHEEFASLAKAGGAKTLLFTTRGRDDRTQGRISRGTRQVAKETGGTVFDAAGAISALHKAQPAIAPYPDGTHPSTQASLMLAIALYREITGTVPVARELRVTAPLLPVNTAVSGGTAMESQAGLSGNGQTTLIPASLIEPLVKALPDTIPDTKEQDRNEGGARGH